MPRLLAVLFLCTVAASLLLGFYFPIKDDEVFYKLLNARLFTDGTLIGLFPQCEGFSTPSPFLWLPARGSEWLIYHGIENIAWIRVIGVASHLFFLGLLLWTSRELLGVRDNILLLAIVALLSLDTLPFLLDINRPEQAIIITVLAMVALALSTHRRGGRPWVVVPVFLLLADVLFAQHAKTFFMLPLVLVCAYYLSGESRRLRYFNYAAVLVFAAVSLHTHMARMHCSYPPVKVVLYNSYLSLDYLLEHPLYFLLVGLFNFYTMFLYYVSIWQAPRHSPSWVPSSLAPLPDTYQFLDDAASVAVSALYVFLWLYVMVKTAKVMFAAFKRTALPAETVIGLALVAGLSMIAAAQMVKMFYEAALFVPLTLLAALLLVPKHFLASAKTKQAALALLAVATLSQADMLFKYGAYATLPAREKDRISHGRELILAGQEDFDQTREEVLAAAKRCSIPTDASGQSVMTDMLTYTFFRDTTQPLSILYIYSFWHGDYRKLSNLLAEKHSSGLVTLCAATSPELSDHMTKQGNFCCLSKSAIEKMQR